MARARATVAFPPSSIPLASPCLAAGKRSTAGYKRRAGEVSLSQLAQSVLGKVSCSAAQGLSSTACMHAYGTAVLHPVRRSLHQPALISTSTLLATASRPHTTSMQPLDKACQCSSWGQRPLSQAQLLYAALDALSAVLIFRGMGQLHHPFQTRNGLLPHTFTYDARHSGGNNGGTADGSKSGSDNPPGGGATGPSAEDSAASNGKAAGGSNGDGGSGSGSSAGGGSAAGSRHVATTWGTGAVHARQQQLFIRRTCGGLGGFNPPRPPVWGNVRSLLACMVAGTSPAGRVSPCWRWRVALRRMLPCRGIAAFPLPGLL
jgi:hypothetical protein